MIGRVVLNKLIVYVHYSLKEVKLNVFLIQ